jgi:hypothetical protein
MYFKLRLYIYIYIYILIVCNLNIIILLMLLHHEINNTLYKIFFYCSIKLSTIPSRMKFVRQGLQFSWFLERATISNKISSGTKLGLRLNTTNVTSSYDLL